MVSELLAIGVNPKRTNIYLQSQIKINYGFLFMILSKMITFNRIARIPSIKNLTSLNKNVIFSLYQFPLLQAIDILSLRAHLVYSNIDNKPNIELVNELVCKFNNRYGYFFPSPKLRIGNIKQLTGIDGKKMSKSKKNCIFFSDSEKIIYAKIMSMLSDCKRETMKSPGNPENCIALLYHHAFNSNKTEVVELENLYRIGNISDLEIKSRLCKYIIDFIQPIQEKANLIRKKEDYILDIIRNGTKNVEIIMNSTIDELSNKLGIKLV